MATRCLALVAVGAGACREAPVTTLAEQGEAAVELWSHPESVGIAMYAPADLKASSRDVAWAVDRVAGAIMRFEPGAQQFGVIGFMDAEPPEVVAPVRLAVNEATGIVAFDDSTGMVDTYTPGGQHVRGFDPGLRPSILEIARRPLRLTFGAPRVGSDSLPRLVVIQTDFLGASPDTLLAPGVGPETVQGLVARSGFMVVSPSESGLWLFSREVPDTVFEISSRGGRKLVLPESDPNRVGVIADLEEQILWVVTPSPKGGLDYEAFDVSSSEAGQVLEAAPRYLGARTTPLRFVGKVATEGAMVGWWSAGGRVVPRAYDMRVAALRESAEGARATRNARRAELARAWEILAEEAATRRAEEE